MGLMLSHALQRRCPQCGGGSLFKSWFRMRERCPTCGIRTERGEEGYTVGAYMFNMVAAELLWATLFLAVLWVTWPHPPWDLLLYGGGALMITAPFFCYPFSKTLFLAFDLMFRPASDTETPDQAGPTRNE